MLINLTPHTVNVQIDGENVEFPPSGVVARVATMELDTGETADGIPLYRRVTGEVEGLPEPREGVRFIVSSMVLESSSRTDLVAPDTGRSAIRDEQGCIVAVRRLICK